MSLLSNLSSLWSPSKPINGAASAPATPARSRTNGVQKSRSRKSGTPYRGGDARRKKLPRAIDEAPALQELSDEDKEPSAERVEFVSQAAPLGPLSPGSDASTQRAPMTSSHGDVSGDNEVDDDDDDDDDDDHPVDLGLDMVTPDEELETEQVNAGGDINEDEDEQYAFTDLLDHRWSGDAIEVKIQWHGSDPTWEPEVFLHQDAPDALFRYWQSRGGRPANPRDPGLYDIFAIRGHSRNKRSLLVEWTGYPPEENCWVPRSVVEKTARSTVKEYWESLK